MASLAFICVATIPGNQKKRAPILVAVPKFFSAFASLAYFDAIEISLLSSEHDIELSLGPTTFTTCGVAHEATKIRRKMRIKGDIK